MEPIAKGTAADVLRFDRSGDFYRQIIENAPVPTGVIGGDGRLIYANRSFLHIFGYAPEQVLGAALTDFIHEEDWTFARFIGRLLNGDADEHRGECRFLRQGGGSVWVEAHGRLFRGERAGRPLYVLLQVVDIDRRKQSEVALHYQEQRWNSALEASGQGVWEHDARRDSMYYSPGWRKMRGFGLAEPIDDAQEAWLKRVHPDDRARIKAVVGKQDRGEDGFDTLEYRELHRAGHYIWILSRGRPVEWDGSGNPIRTVGTDTDITKLKTIELQLAEEKERLRVTLESIGDGVISTDADGRVSFLNPIAEEMTGWTAGDALGQPVAKVFSIRGHSSESQAQDPVAASLENGQVVYVDEEMVLVGRSGKRRDIRCSAAPVRTPHGEALGAVLVFQDITESRALQKELAHSANHDGLTGLPNRPAFERALAAAVDSVRSERRTSAVCFIDLDSFKSVNDSAGHAAGDALLRQVAEAIRHGCRAEDFAARIGGDEFGLILGDCSPEGARIVAQKIVKSIADIAFDWNGRRYRIGASVGIAPVGDDAAATLAAADAGCYAAKAAGRGRVALARANAGR